MAGEISELKIGNAMFNDHVKTGRGWRTTLSMVTFTLVIHICSGIWFVSSLSSTVKGNTKTIGEHSHSIERVNKHISEDEVRWNFFDISDAHKLKER